MAMVNLDVKVRNVENGGVGFRRLYLRFPDFNFQYAVLNIGFGILNIEYGVLNIEFAMLNIHFAGLSIGRAVFEYSFPGGPVLARVFFSDACR